MKKLNISLIWDLDGTLLDSYEIIVDGICSLCDEYAIKYDRTDISNDVIRESVSYYLNKVSKETGISFDILKKKYSEITGLNNNKIKRMNHALELLEILKKYGIKNYVFTHRGKSTEEVLKNVGLYNYFDFIITMADGFKRKPNPEAINYLVSRFNLDNENTYYIGDRSLDMECGFNANIKTILYKPKMSVTILSGKETFIIEDLLEIIDIFGLNSIDV